MIALFCWWSCVVVVVVVRSTIVGRRRGRTASWPTAFRWISSTEYEWVRPIPTQSLSWPITLAPGSLVHRQLVPPNTAQLSPGTYCSWLLVKPPTLESCSDSYVFWWQRGWRRQPCGLELVAGTSCGCWTFHCLSVVMSGINLFRRTIRSRGLVPITSIWSTPTLNRWTAPSPDNLLYSLLSFHYLLVTCVLCVCFTRLSGSITIWCWTAVRWVADLSVFTSLNCRGIFWSLCWERNAPRCSTCLMLLLVELLRMAVSLSVSFSLIFTFIETSVPRSTKRWFMNFHP